MPNMGASTEFVQQREDEMAALIDACDEVDKFRALGRILAKKKVFTPAYYRDYRDGLDKIARALHVGRKNTAARRREAC